jgi:hypothetical protein
VRALFSTKASIHTKRKIQITKSTFHFPLSTPVHETSSWTPQHWGRSYQSSHVLLFQLVVSQCQRRRLLELLEENDGNGTRLNCPTIPRTRKSMTQLFRELGPNYFRRSFRMSFDTFKKLYFILKPWLEARENHRPRRCYQRREGKGTS